MVAVTAPHTALADSSGNPFLQAWTLPDGAPPFDLVKEAHFLPAFEAGIAPSLCAEAIIDDSRRTNR